MPGNSTEGSCHVAGERRPSSGVSGNVLEAVRTACAEVARRSRHVRLVEERVAPYAASLPLEEIAAPTLDPRFHYLGEPEATLAFVLVLDAINFGSGYFPHLRKRPGMSGYFTVASALKDRFERHGPFTASDLTRLTAEGCAELLGQGLGGPVADLMGLAARALNDLGRFLLDRFEGRFAGPVEAAERSAARLVELLGEMPFYRDIQRYDDLVVPLYKRAQLTAADLALAFAGTGWGRFDDLDRLTIFADNLVPHVLRLDGVLEYEPALVDRIEAEELIPAGSPEEIEIRAVAVHAVERIGDALRASGAAVTSMQLDYLLWNRGQQPAYKARPRHRTRTVFY